MSGTFFTHEAGVKYDEQKPRYDLLPPGPVREVVKVLTFGAQKYEDDNWMKVPGARRRYVAAYGRHLAAYQEGEKLDRETGLSHLAHAVCCIIFLMWFDQNGDPPEIEGPGSDERSRALERAFRGAFRGA